MLYWWVNVLLVGQRYIGRLVFYWWVNVLLVG